MSTRTPPSLEQIVEVVTRIPDADSRVLPWTEVHDVIRRELHTTHAKAEQWLNKALYDSAMHADEGPLLDMRISIAGYLGGLARINTPAKSYYWPKLEVGALITTAVYESLDCSEADAHYLRVGPEGRFFKEEQGNRIPPDRGLSASLKNGDRIRVVVLPETFAKFAKLAAEARADIDLLRGAEEIVGDAAVEQHPMGDTVARVRTLLDKAGVHRATVRATAPKDEDDFSHLTITLMEDDILRLGEALRLLGIEPKW